MANDQFAFPRPASNGYEGQRGMTLRDWFAGLAAQGCVQGAVSDKLLDDLGSVEAVCESIALAAYRVADAMLAHREEPRNV